MEKLTRQEEDVMCLVWKLSPCFIKDILAQLQEPKPPYTTLASVVKNLERKKYVKVRKFGNIYEYEPLINQLEYKRNYMDQVAENFFAASYKEMISFFITEQKISSGELRGIIDQLEAGRE